ncbi:uncharacterized protein P884DRAFT_127140 [Thermothelomyces heterothallicus CBS 202.75]|uniref:uncharacterized protein n=1 Tax=Thermothelomyces heterothallicus CBS 202.75 TaxID=1149848 RepID=UPI003743A3E4
MHARIETVVAPGIFVAFARPISKTRCCWIAEAPRDAKTRCAHYWMDGPPRSNKHICSIHTARNVHGSTACGVRPPWTAISSPMPSGRVAQRPDAAEPASRARRNEEPSTPPVQTASHQGPRTPPGPGAESGLLTELVRAAVLGLKVQRRLFRGIIAPLASVVAREWVASYDGMLT